MPAKRVLFINKTAESKQLSRSEGAERSLVFSHVQQGSRSHSFEENTTGQNSSSVTLPLRASHTPRTLRQRDQSRALIAKRHQSEERSQRVNLKNDATISQLRAEQLALQSSSIASLRLKLEYSARSTRTYLGLLGQFYRSSASLRIFPTQAIADESKDDTFVLCTRDPGFCNALLSTIAAAAYSNNKDPQHHVNELYFKSHAMKLLSMQLGPSASGALKMSSAYAVSLLLWLECIRGQSDDLRIHASGLQNVVDRISDPEKLHYSAAIAIFSSYHLCCAMLRTNPSIRLWSMITHKPHLTDAIASFDSQTIPSEGMTSSFFTIANTHLLGPKLTQLVVQQRHYISNRFVWAGDTPEPTAEQHEALNLIEIQVEHGLVSLPFENAITPAQDAVRLALFTFSQPIIHITNPMTAFCRSMAGQIKDALMQTLFSSWGESSDLLLWVLFVGAHISQGQPEWDWFLGGMRKLLVEREVKGPSQMRDILSGFYYSKTYFQQTLITVWRLIMSEQ